MNRINIVYYSLFSLIFIFFIVYLIIVFRDRDYKIGVINFIKTKTNNKCYDIKITDKNTHDNLYKIMYNFDMVCKKYNLEYFATAGTLLGAIRHKKIIPWDDDLDVIIKIEYIDKLTNKVFPELFRKGFAIERGTLTNNYRLIIKGLQYPFMDIFFYIDQGSNIVSKSTYFSLLYPKEKKLSKDLIYPLKRYKFGNIEVNGPNKAVMFLKKIYGNKVMEEVVGTFFDHNTFSYYRLCKKKLKDIDPKYI